MKKIYLLLIAIFSSFYIAAQTPQAFKYQAIARDEAGNILLNWDIGLRISILRGDQAGEEIYIETHQVKSNVYGLINLVIGEGTVIKGDMGKISWGENGHCISIEIDINGGNDYKIVETSALYSVPYALYAEQAGNIAEKEIEQQVSAGNSSRKKHYSNTDNRNGNPNSKFPANGNSYINANVGNLGIGTTSPQEKLDVNPHCVKN